MVDIATVSVISSAAVALGTLVVNFIGGERQRSHEADLDFERRVWEQKSTALFAVIGVCRSLVLSDDPVTDENRSTYAINLSQRLDELLDAQGAVDAFASSNCRRELTELVNAMFAMGVKYDVGRRHHHWVTRSTEVSPSDQEWGWYLDWRREAEAEAVADFEPDLADLAARGGRLLEAARESARQPKD